MDVFVPLERFNYDKSRLNSVSSRELFRKCLMFCDVYKTCCFSHLFHSLILLALAGSVGITLLIVACALPTFNG